MICHDQGSSFTGLFDLLRYIGDVFTLDAVGIRESHEIRAQSIIVNLQREHI